MVFADDSEDQVSFIANYKDIDVKKRKVVTDMRMRSTISE